PAKRVVRTIAFPNRDEVRWVEFLHQDRKVQSRRSAADDVDFHLYTKLTAKTPGANDEFGMMNAEQANVLLIIHHSAFIISFLASLGTWRLVGILQQLIRDDQFLNL